MKKGLKSVIVGMGVSMSAFAMTQLPEGNYTGNGRWVDSQGKKGSYTVETQVVGNTVDSKYAFDGQERQWKFTAKFDANGFFDVEASGRAVGQGYCQAVQCHYSLEASMGSLEETLSFVDGNLYRLGSKVVAGTKISWEEDLIKR